MSQPRQIPIMGRGNQGVDTTFTKIFVGGLAWKTQRDTMQRYFEQFGEIVEAVVITDKNTGKSKGYGFVTFKEPEAATRACQNPSPVIDGRRANCNLATLGATSNYRPPTPIHGAGRFRAADTEGLRVSSANYFHGSSSYIHQPSGPYNLPYSAYGYSGGYSQENLYSMNYYVGYGSQHFSPYYTTGAGRSVAGVSQDCYPFYSSYGQSSSQTHGFGVQFPVMLHYPYMPRQHGGFVGNTPLSSSTPLPLPAATPTTTTGTTTSTTNAAAAACEMRARETVTQPNLTTSTMNAAAAATSSELREKETVTQPNLSSSSSQTS